MIFHKRERENNYFNGKQENEINIEYYHRQIFGGNDMKDGYSLCPWSWENIRVVYLTVCAEETS